jgi:dephospho-CoA kinase
MRIICVVGLIGCGKDTASDYIEKKYGYHTISTGDIIRTFAKRDGLELTRENLHKIRRKYGNIFIGEETIKIIKEKKLRHVLLNGVRRSEDYEIPKKAFGNVMRMILINTDKENRFKRLKARGLPRDPKNAEDFEDHEKNESEIYDFDKTFSYADFKIENNGSKQDLYKKIDNVMKEIERIR